MGYPEIIDSMVFGEAKIFRISLEIYFIAERDSE